MWGQYDFLKEINNLFSMDTFKMIKSDSNLLCYKIHLI